MSYGILVVECDDAYMILGEVASVGEAHELARNYKEIADPEWGDVPPDVFVILTRDERGLYVRREEVRT